MMTWQQVAQRIEERMGELALTRTDVIRASGVSPMTFRALLAGERTGYRDGSLHAVSKALGWAPTAIIDLTKTGKEPALIGRPSEPWVMVARRIDERMAELEIVQADVARIARVSAATVRSLLNADRDNYRPGSMRSVSRALSWTPISIEELARAGTEPTPVSGLPPEEDHWDTVAVRIEERMAECRFLRTDLANRSGASPLTIRALLAGERTGYRRDTLRKISVALGWAPTAIEDLASTGQGTSGGDYLSSALRKMFPGGMDQDWSTWAHGVLDANELAALVRIGVIQG